MRALFINENIGGHATVHHHLRVALAERSDIDASFIDLPPVAGLARFAGARIPGLARLDLDFQPLRAQLARSTILASLVRRRISDADVVHLYTHNAGLLSTGVWRRIPTVVSLDTTNAQNLYRRPGRLPTRFTPLTVAATKPFEQRVYRAATTVVANSQWAAGSLVDDYDLPPDRIVVQPFGIGDPNPNSTALTNPDPSVRPRAVFVGRSLLRKGGKKLMRVHNAGLVDRLDLTLVTEEPTAPSRAIEVISDVQPGDDRLWEILRASSMFVFPSEIDMAPNAVLEAMMAGLPVIARPVGAIPEMVEHGVTGLLVGQEDHHLANAITELLDDPVRAATMGAAGRARALSIYDAKTTTDAVIEILRSTITRFDANSSKPSQRIGR